MTEPESPFRFVSANEHTMTTVKILNFIEKHSMLYNDLVLVKDIPFNSLCLSII